MSTRVRQILSELEGMADPTSAAHLQRFFRIGPGEYGEGDRFLGIRVPLTRSLARRYHDLSPDECARLLQSEWHEARLLALLILVRAYDRGDDARREQIFRLYLDNTARINNWDLVDASAPHIVGRHLRRGQRSVLRRLAGSASVWERRIAVLATFDFIRSGDFADTLALARRLLTDRHDLIHKSVGWMLREVGKRDRRRLEEFLAAHAAVMPRTMLRYAIEKFEPEERAVWLGRS